MRFSAELTQEKVPLVVRRGEGDTSLMTLRLQYGWAAFFENRPIFALAGSPQSHCSDTADLECDYMRCSDSNSSVNRDGAG